MAVAVSYRQRSLRQNVGSALSGNVVYALCQFGMLSVLALLTSPTEVGRYALALAITAPVFLFASLKLRQVQATDAAHDYAFGEYLAQRLISSVLAAVTIVSVVAFLNMDPRTFATITAVTVFKALESVIDILYGAMQRREQLHLVARSQIWRGAGGFAVFACAIWLTGRVEIAVSALAVFTAAQVVTNFWRVKRLGVAVRPLLSWAALLRLTWLALPLGAALALSSLTVNVPRYFMEATQGTAELGIFAALAYLLTITGMIMASLGEASSPRLANLFFAQKFRQFRRVLAKLVVTGAGLGIVGVIVATIAGPFVLTIIYGPEYAAHNDVLVVLMGAAAVLNTTAFLGTAVNAMRRFRVQLPINIAVLATVAAVSWFLVPSWGIMGGAIAMAAGELAAVALYVILIFRVVLPSTASRPRHRAQN